MRNRKLLTLLVFLIALTLIFLSLTAASPHKARLWIINQTGDDIFLSLTDPETGLIAYNLRIHGSPMPDATLVPTAGPKPTRDPNMTPTVTATPFDIDRFKEENTTLWTIERKVYSAVLVGCGVVLDGTMDLSTNLHLNITPCLDMLNYDEPRYLGEPTFEKPNWFLAPGMANWRFRYFLPEVDLNNYPAQPSPVPSE